jgi:hypothetical protein
MWRALYGNGSSHNLNFEILKWDYAAAKSEENLKILKFGYYGTLSIADFVLIAVLAA